MAEGDNKKKSPFSIYWIYAFIGITLIGYSLFMSSAGEIPVKYESTFFDLAEKGYVTEAQLVNKVRVDFKVSNEGLKYIKNSKEDQYQGLKKYLSTKSPIKSSQPIFIHNVVDAGNFDADLSELNKKIEAENFIKKQKNQKELPTVQLVDVEEVNYLMNILSFLLPILLFIGIWMFVMRRMSGGGGGGGGGGSGTRVVATRPTCRQQTIGLACRGHFIDIVGIRTQID